MVRLRSVDDLENGSFICFTWWESIFDIVGKTFNDEFEQRSIVESKAT